MDSTYSKAFARRATARVALGKLQGAKQGTTQVANVQWGLKVWTPLVKTGINVPIEAKEDEKIQMRHSYTFKKFC